MTYVSVDIDLNDVDSDDLIEELESRGYDIPDKGDKPDAAVRDVLLEDLNFWMRQKSLNDVLRTIGRMFPKECGNIENVAWKDL